MVDNIKQVFRMFGIYGKLDLLWFLRDTKYCLLQIVADVVSSAGAVLGAFLLSERLNGFGGMNRGQMLFMLGYAISVDGMYMLLFGASNTGMMSRVIGRGQLDHNMIQPVPLWIQILTEGFAPCSGVGLLVCGLGTVSYAVSLLYQELSAIWIVLMMFLLLCSCSVIFSTVTLISCMAFYAPAAAEEICCVGRNLFDQLKSYPMGGLGGVWQVVFTVIVPVGATAWIPSMALSGAGYGQNILWSAAGLTAAVAALLLLITLFVFKKGINYYAVNGSPRYTGFGHR